jgi:hypothetical protein
METATETFPCPIGWCSTFPYDRPEDLADHLANHPPAPGKFAPAPAPVASAPVSDPTPIRSFSPGGTRAAAAPANLCSDKQANFIRSLADRKGAELPDFATLTKRDASTLIDGLLSADDKPREQAAPARSGITLEHGRVYAMADGTFVKVTESKAGNLYGKLLDGDGKFTDYQPGLLPRITRDLTAEEAARFGHEHHRCVFCSRNLSDETDGRSVDVGYGPICANKYGLPWG